jgi:molybdenum-dependent DNA-binding transcriptional regulator ModE
MEYRNLGAILLTARSGGRREGHATPEPWSAPELLKAAKEARDELSQCVARWADQLAARLDEAIKEAEGQEE